MNTIDVNSQPARPAETDAAGVCSVPRDLCKRSWLSTQLNTLKQRLLTRAPLILRAIRPPRVAGACGILVYHRVAPHAPGVAKPTWNVTPRQFRGQLTGLLARGYEPWPLRKVLAHQSAGRPVPRNVFVVTFDDGYANFYHEAWPVLRELNIPATIFLATSYLDRREPFPFDDWAAAGRSDVPRESWIPLTTAQCAELQAGGLVELGAHTHTHADFRQHPDELRRDLVQCRDVLQQRFGVAVPTFAFPYGRRTLGFSGQRMARAAREAGMLCALTTEQELVEPGSDPYDWGRLTASDVDTAATLAAKLDGWYSWLRESSHRMVNTGRALFQFKSARWSCPKGNTVQ